MPSDNSIWKPTNESHKLAVAITNFNGAVKNGLKLKLGESVHCFEETGGWYYGVLIRDRTKKGIFPSNNVVHKPCMVQNLGEFETIVEKDDYIVQEINDVLREWLPNWTQLFVNSNKQKVELFNIIKQNITQLLQWRKLILQATLSSEMLLQLRDQVVNKIVSGNCALGLDFIPRIDNQVVDFDSVGIFRLYREHETIKEDFSSKYNVSSSNSTRMSGKKKHSLPQAHHIYVWMKGFICNVGDDSELIFGVYDGKLNHYITESYCISMNKFGIPKDADKCPNNMAIFTDLTNSDLVKELYIVVKVYRCGKLIPDKKGDSNFRRPFGCSVFCITDILKAEVNDNNEDEFVMQIYACSDADFGNIEDHIIKKNVVKYTNLSNNSIGIVLSIIPLHGALENIKAEKPSLFKDSVIICRRLGFPEVMDAVFSRNDLYVTLKRGEFEKGNKSHPRSVELIVTVVTDKGQILPSCMSFGNGGMMYSEFHSHVIYHNNNPLWNNTLKVIIPPNMYEKCHIRFIFKHCSQDSSKSKGDNMFAFTILKLTKPDGSVINNKEHECFVYKMDPSVDFRRVSSYLSWPFSANDTATNVQSPPPNLNEIFIVRTQYVSTCLTTNSCIALLSHWEPKSSSIPDMKQFLSAFLYVDGEEVIKFIIPIVRNICQILETNPDVMIFRSLLSVLSLVSDKRFVQYKPLLENFIDNEFQFKNIHNSLTEASNEALKNFKNKEMRETIKYILKSLKYIVKMIVSSNNSNDLKTNSIINMKNELLPLFGQLFSCLENKQEYLYSLQIEALSSFSQIFNELSKILTPGEFSQLIKNFLQSIQSNVQTGTAANKLNTQKMYFLRELAESDVFTDIIVRKNLIPVMVKIVQYNITIKYEIPICLDIIGFITCHLESFEPSSVSDDVSYLVNEILGIFIDISVTAERKGSFHFRLLTVLISMFNLMEDAHYELFFKRLSYEDIGDFSIKIFSIFKEVIYGKVYPNDWFLVWMTSTSIMCKVCTYIISYVMAASNSSQKTDYFDQTVYVVFFNFAIPFCMVQQLQLESFTTFKRARILSRFGDLRITMATLICDTFKMIGPHCSLLVDKFAGSLIEVTLIPQSDIRKVTISIFYTIMDYEYKATKSLLKIESMFIDHLDTYTALGRGDEKYQQELTDLIVENISCLPDSDSFKLTALKCMKNVSDAFDLQLSFHNACKSHESNILQMLSAYNLMRFYENIGRKDLYVRNLYRVFDQHMASGNVLEAGCSLLLHADMLKWSVNMYKGDSEGTNACYMSEAEKKERLYLEIIDLFDRGKCWELAIKICNILATQYESTMIDYLKLSEILKQLATFYEYIMTQVRPDPEYFKVAFYGKSFPTFLRNQVVIARGKDYEKLPEFVKMLKMEFSDSEILSHNLSLDASVINSDKKTIQCCRVVPVPESAFYQKYRQTDERISSFYKCNEVNTFTVSRPFHQGKKNEANEFTTLCLEKTTLYTTFKFPGVLKWSPVTKVDVVTLSPIEVAIESIETKNQEIIQILLNIEKNEAYYMKTLTMTLNGIIDAAVNGGISKYQSAFLGPNYLNQRPQDAKLVESLKSALDDQISNVDVALDVHEKHVSSDLRPLHDRLVQMYSLMRKELGVNTTKKVNGSMLSISSNLLSNASLQSGLHSINSQRPEYATMSKVSNVDLMTTLKKSNMRFGSSDLMNKETDTANTSPSSSATNTISSYNAKFNTLNGDITCKPIFDNKKKSRKKILGRIINKEIL